MFLFAEYKLTCIKSNINRSVEKVPLNGLVCLFAFIFPETCSPDHHHDANNNIVLSGTSGRLFSPLFPLNYGVKIQCRWTIKVPEGHRIKLSFQAFHLGLKGLGNCDKVDRVEVRDSFDKNNPSYGFFCGNVVPAPINTVGPRMLVTFVSDEERVFQGFEAKFDATSEGRIFRIMMMMMIIMTRIMIMTIFYFKNAD